MEPYLCCELDWLYSRGTLRDIPNKDCDVGEVVDLLHAGLKLLGIFFPMWTKSLLSWNGICEDTSIWGVSSRFGENNQNEFLDAAKNLLTPY